MLPGFRVSDVVGRLFDSGGIVGPIVGDVVVHLGRIPNLGRQEVDGVNVALRGVVDDHLGVDALAFDRPIGRWDGLTGAAVDHLPPAGDVACQIGGHLLCKPARHDVDLQLASTDCGDALRHQIDAGALLGVCQRPFLVAASDKVGGVDLRAEIRDQCGQFSAV